MTNIPDKDAPSNPYQAKTIADLITPNQLHWLTTVAESLGMDKDQTAIALFNCTVLALSRDAASQLEQYFAKVKMDADPAYDYQHPCAACGDTFPCNQPLCPAGLAPCCHDCKADLFTAA
jgi:hypothetical protein